jgi:hypothetical protein
LGGSGAFLVGGVPYSVWRRAVHGGGATSVKRAGLPCGLVWFPSWGCTRCGPCKRRPHQQRVRGTRSHRLLPRRGFIAFLKRWLSGVALVVGTSEVLQGSGWSQWTPAMVVVGCSRSSTDGLISVVVVVVGQWSMWSIGKWSCWSRCAPTVVSVARYWQSYSSCSPSIVSCSGRVLPLGVGCRSLC